MAAATVPARCAVAVIFDHHLVAQVLPAAVPVEAFIDDVVELFNDELRGRGQPGLATDTGYELQRVNGVRLELGKTLDQSGVEDGASLVLVPAEAGEPFAPQYESLSTGLARTGTRLFAPLDAVTAAHLAVGMLALCAATLAAAAVRARLAVDSPAPALLTAAAGAATAGALGVTLRWWPRRRDLIAGFGWVATGVLATSAALAAPGEPGAAHLVIGALAAAVLTAALAVIAGRDLPAAAAVVTVCALGAAAAAPRMWRPVPAAWLGAGVLVALLLVLTAAPTIALWVARIRPPHFGSVTGRDLFWRTDGLPPDAVSPVPADPDADATRDPDADTTPSGARLVAAATRAHDVLTGVCVGAAAVFPVAAWVTVEPDRGPATGWLVGLFVLIFCGRSRAFTARAQAAALLCGAGGAVCVTVARYVFTRPPQSITTLALAAAVLAAVAAGVLLAALVVPSARFTPLVRMTVEWIELAAIVAALPLAAGLCGLFSWVRMR
ncbi:type VII secretion integral membrane protein EccD [Mycolicibacillus parakoreensis]|uniref:Type VII secretion integral membrane protein EccD n=1 Tax=Mycolicibacillus parakoreensis TaxID=1069221 RepID=A0ABY3U1M6_9MYCO|nr:type VII secretion integral membrane protein EccD [Mycolicibacillus parakoreensis]MCV7316544.1 type VII secretion integral membrane protein EccD [Mycolicibacillus parakoreensis]ULN52768.1 type VII secretion integral membrane protein EccD [Mycolicibacillus parakoreensis]